ncbi:50S ribosomal protein L11 methyltransferase [Hyphobacterium marinum]|uniref:Ribosomal protein L11 methyltransferase n=1 Tax=Hyphobacterium marinum TaxID=3116574 RepID=A0ABU7LXW8_9PROT|nr:50S ribosomal protein L11 methyltransferase [Hyphobacterium sp. Y6023]MEE2566035.1 50S ribosomal protein L11 methyltransferase [Hyphobacterium sp. Y6023]
MTLWKLAFTGPISPLYAAAECLDGVEDNHRLSWSVFEDEGEETGALEILFDAPPDEDRQRAAVSLGAEHEARILPLPEEDWVKLSQAGLPPVIAGRFALHGSHDDAPEGKIAILIEAGPAFGTGHHGTTKGCLLAFDAMLEDGFKPATILDIGTGTGALAIAAAKVLPRARIVASDIDPDATEEARANCRTNGVADAVDCFTAENFNHIKLIGAKFDLVFANILAEPLVDLAPQIAAALNPGAPAILSGLLVEQEAMVRSAYEAQGLTVTACDPLDGWATLVAVKGG